MLHISQSNLQKPVIYGPKAAEQVYHQMLPDFPGQAIQWVLRSSWEGPEHIPLTMIDTANRANWTASHEPEKVQMHQELIKQGLSKPIILGNFHGHPKLIIIDAHHRFLAYEALHLPPVCWVGMIAPADSEEALTCHSKQYSGQSKLEGP